VIRIYGEIHYDGNVTPTSDSSLYNLIAGSQADSGKQVFQFLPVVQPENWFTKESVLATNWTQYVATNLNETNQDTLAKNTYVIESFGFNNEIGPFETGDLGGGGLSRQYINFLPVASNAGGLAATGQAIMDSPPLTLAPYTWSSIPIVDQDSAFWMAASFCTYGCDSIVDYAVRNPVAGCFNSPADLNAWSSNVTGSSNRWILSSGGDPLTGAPTPITPAQRKEAGIDWVPEKAPVK
jgi:hypothetical protein